MWAWPPPHAAPSVRRDIKHQQRNLLQDYRPVVFPRAMPLDDTPSPTRGYTGKAMSTSPLSAVVYPIPQPSCFEGYLHFYYVRPFGTLCVPALRTVPRKGPVIMKFVRKTKQSILTKRLPRKGGMDYGSREKVSIIQTPDSTWSHYELQRL